MFPDGSAGQEFGTVQSQTERMAALGGAAPVAPESGDTGSLLPNAPPGLSGTTPQQVAEQFGELSALGGHRVGYSLASDPTAPPDAVKAVLPKVTVVCPRCGHQQAITHGLQRCKECDQQLQHPEYAEASADETPFVGNAFSQRLAGREMVLNLADSTNDDADVSTVGSESVASDHPSSVECPACGKLNDWDNVDCMYCGAALAPAKQKALNGSVDQELDQMVLHLSGDQVVVWGHSGGLDLAPNQAQRQQWAKEGKALPDGSWPIPNVAYLKKACQAFPGRAKGQEDRIKRWITKRANALNAADIPEMDRVKNYGSSTSASQQEHNATLVALQLDHTQGEQGLVWKVLCKTGTLALSPGPGQMDMEKPLNLTADMFQAVKQAYDERAFEHVTIPETHGNGTLENCGTVDALEILSKPQALADARLSQATKGTFDQDPADTLYMLGGMRFTDPKAKEKACNGSILNCSVGLKFNYRRKRDGKLFPVALEHTALTNQPWVDGLGTFGTGELAQPFDQSRLPVWDGVFVPQQNGGTLSSASLSEPGAAGGLPFVDDDDRQPGEQSLEQILASQQATIERLQQEAQQRADELRLAQGRLNDQGYELHLSRTNARVTELQNMGVPPAVLKRYKELRLAAYHAQDGVLQLSVKEGDNTVEKPFGAIEQAEYLLAAMPLGDPNDNVIAITSGKARAEALALSQEQHERTELTASQKADQVERDLHPERFDPEGKRIPVEERRPGRQAKP